MTSNTNTEEYIARYELEKRTTTEKDKQRQLAEEEKKRLANEITAMEYSLVQGNWKPFQRK
jgi:hypothetical protein